MLKQLSSYVFLLIAAVSFAGEQTASFDALLKKYQDLSYGELKSKTYNSRNYLDKISFDPAECKYYQNVKDVFPLAKKAEEKLKTNGFVVVSKNRKESFGTAYYHIYTNDLPVFITTDSILNALHKSYDEIVKELEDTAFSIIFTEVLQECHEQLVKEQHQLESDVCKIAANNVDQYLCIARNLLAGAGTDVIQKGYTPKKREYSWDPIHDIWNGKLIVPSKLGNEAVCLKILKKISKLEMDSPIRNKVTKLYHGRRGIDFTQFIPRGHYIDSTELKRYFRLMMWLGRADTGFIVQAPSNNPYIKCNPKQELVSAALLVLLVEKTNNLERLEAINRILDLLVGQQDFLGVNQLLQLLQKCNIREIKDLNNESAMSKLQEQIKTGDYQQNIQSQIVYSDPLDSVKVEPPVTFQIFGQRFCIDSFVLSKVVFDNIIYKGVKQKRKMPSGLDVMAAFGNQEAIALQKGELEEFHYSSNLMALIDLIDSKADSFWTESVYNIWLNSLRALDSDVAAIKHVPEAMKTKTWQLKQLQTQLASWAQLRHDTILYAKQSFSDGTLCEYPAGYIEPYPETYKKLQLFADKLVTLYQNIDFVSNHKDEKKTVTKKVEKKQDDEDYLEDDEDDDPYNKKLSPQEKLDRVQKSQTAFLNNFTNKLKKLENLAKKELAGTPFSDEENTFIKKTIDKREMSGGPNFDGWYCDLYYYRNWQKGTSRWQHTAGGALAYKWDPEIADVHTDPDSEQCLEVAVGNVNFAIIAIDNKEDRSMYVGPVFSYYEFPFPADNRLNDDDWQAMLSRENVPEAPRWTQEFSDLMAKNSVYQIDKTNLKNIIKKLNHKNWRVGYEAEERFENVINDTVIDSNTIKILEDAVKNNMDISKFFYAVIKSENPDAYRLLKYFFKDYISIYDFDSLKKHLTPDLEKKCLELAVSDEEFIQFNSSLFLVLFNNPKAILLFKKFIQNDKYKNSYFDLIKDCSWNNKQLPFLNNKEVTDILINNFQQIKDQYLKTNREKEYQAYREFSDEIEKSIKPLEYIANFDYSKDLIDILNHSDSDLTRLVIRLIGELKDKDNIDPLLTKYHAYEHKCDIDNYIIDAISQVEDKKIIIERLMSDENYENKYLLLRALEISNKADAPTVIPLKFNKGIVINYLVSEITKILNKEVIKRGVSSFLNEAVKSVAYLNSDDALAVVVNFIEKEKDTDIEIEVRNSNYDDEDDEDDEDDDDDEDDEDDEDDDDEDDDGNNVKYIYIDKSKLVKHLNCIDLIELSYIDCLIDNALIVSDCSLDAFSKNELEFSYRERGMCLPEGTKEELFISSIVSLVHRPGVKNREKLCIVLLKHKSPVLRAAGLRGLYNAKSQKAYPLIKAIFEEDLVELRKLAVSTLASYENREALDLVAAQLKSRSPDLKNKCALALASYGDPRAFSKINSILKYENKERDLYYLAFQSLENYKDNPEARAIIQKVASDNNPTNYFRDKAIRIQKIWRKKEANVTEK